MDGQVLTLTLAINEERISGRLRDERGHEYGFSSWLGLVSVLEAAHAGTAAAPADSRVRVAYESED
jgi:hypothetical protein